MKKFKAYSILLSIVFLFGCVICSACGKITVTKVAITSEIASVVQNEQPDFTNVTAEVTFSDKSTKVVSYDDLTFDQVDTTTIGLKKGYVQYKGSDKKFEFTITVISSTEISVTVNGYTGSYDGENHDAVIISNLLDGDKVYYSSDNKATWKKSVPHYKDAGTYDIYVKVERPYFNTLDKKVVCQISKATLNMSNVKWDYSSAFIYDATAHSVVLSNLPSVITATYSQNTQTVVGTYTASVSFTYDTDNYNAVASIADLVWKIEPATIDNVVVSGYNGTYDELEHSISVSGLVDGDIVYFSLDDKKTWTLLTDKNAPSLTDAGSLAVYVKVCRENYNDFVSQQVNIIVNKKNEMGITINSFNGAFDSQSHSISLTGLQATDVIKYSTDGKVTWQTENPTLLHVGTITVNVLISRENYEDAELTGAIVIIKGSYTGASITGYSDVYDGLSHTVEVTGLPESVVIDGETQSASIKYSTDGKKTWVDEKPTFTNVGNTTVYVKISHYDYVDVILNADVEITPATITEITAVAYNGEYDGKAHSVDVSGTVENDIVSFSTDKQNWLTEYTLTNVGTAEVYVKITRVNYNDLILNETYQIDITARVLKIDWSNTSLTYTGGTLIPTATITNLVDGEECLLTLQGEEILVGTNYIATIIGLTGKDVDNYVLPTTTTQTFNIVKAQNKWTISPIITDTDGTLQTSGKAQFGAISYEYKQVDEDDSKYTSTMPTKFGSYTMKATVKQTSNYNGLSTTYDFEFGATLSIAYFESALLTSYTDNVTNFTDKNVDITAGDDNSFDLQISGKYVNTSGALKVITYIPTAITFEVYEGGAYQTADFADYATIKSGYNTIVFNSNATSKSFRLSVLPTNINADHTTDVNTLVFNVNVVDGYNVYSAKDLSVIGNVSSHGWTEWKEANGYTNIAPNAVVIQKDITILDSDIPSYFFFTETEAAAVPSELTNLTITGSMKDGENNTNTLNIYQHNCTGTETFTFYGNCFLIDYSQLSRAVVDSHNASGIKYVEDDSSGDALITTHTSLMGFYGQKTTTFNVNDIQIKGNGGRSSRSLNSGGIMFAKTDGTNANVKNCIYIDCFIGFMFQSTSSVNYDVKFTLTDTIGRNSYNTLLYMYGAKSVYVENCQFVGAGGPAMIADDVIVTNADETQTHYPSNVVTVNCDIQSYVTGAEPWFVSYGATSMAASLKEANAYYTAQGSTYLQKIESVSGLMNLKIVYKSGSSAGLSTAKLEGSVIMFDSIEDYNAQVVATTPTISTYALDLTTYSAPTNNILQNSRNGDIFGVGSGYATVAATGTTNLNIYITNGMAIVLGLYTYSA